MKTFLLWLAVSGQAADVTSTLHALERGCREWNPALRWMHITTGPRIALMKGGVTAGLVWDFTSHYDKHQTSRTASALIVGGIGWTAAVLNQRAMC